MKALLVAGILAAAVLWGNHAGAQSPKVNELIPKATAYAHQFVERFTNVVAEERYEQEITVPRRKRVLRVGLPPGQATGRRALESLQRCRRSGRQAGARPRGPAHETVPRSRLPIRSARAAEIREAGARHNLADIGTLNNPLLVIAFLQSQYVDRFRFNLAGLDKKLGPDVRTVRFVEFRRPTVLKLNANADLFSRGLIWIEEATGRVVKTELQFGQADPNHDAVQVRRGRLGSMSRS